MDKLRTVLRRVVFFRSIVRFSFDMGLGMYNCFWLEHCYSEQYINRSSVLVERQGIVVTVVFSFCQKMFILVSEAKNLLKKDIFGLRYV